MIGKKEEKAVKETIKNSTKIKVWSREELKNEINKSLCKRRRLTLNQISYAIKKITDQYTIFKGKNNGMTLYIFVKRKENGLNNGSNKIRI